MRPTSAIDQRVPRIQGRKPSIAKQKVAKVAVELNGEIAPRSTLEDVALNDGDVLEIVHFVGGG